MSLWVMVTFTMKLTMCSYHLTALALRTLTGKQQNVTSRSLGPSKETYKEATKTKQVHLVSNGWKMELDIKWEKWITLSHCAFKNNSWKHNFRLDKPSSSLIESTWSNHLIRSEKPQSSAKEKEIKMIIILPDGKYTTIHHSRNQNNYHLTCW